MKRHIYYPTTALTVILLAFFLKDFVAGKIITPILEMIRVFDDLPQALLWFFSIGVVILFEWKNMIGWALPDSAPRPLKKRQEGRIENLADLIHRARREPYSRKKLSQYLAELTFAALAYREGSTPKVMRERLNSGTLNVPAEILDYFKAGFRKNVPYPKKFIGFLTGPGPEGGPIDLDPVQVLEFLEQQLEVGYEGRKD